MKFSDAIEGFSMNRLADGYSPTTLRSYASYLTHLCNWLGDPEVEKITHQDLKRFTNYIKTEYKPVKRKVEHVTSATEANYWKSMRCFFTWNSEVAGIPDVSEGLVAPKASYRVIIPFSREEVKLLLAACEHTAADRTGPNQGRKMRRPTGIRDKLILLYFLDTGVRLGELCRLTVRDVNLQTRDVNVIPFSTGLKSKGRVVRIGKGTRSLTWRYLAEREDKQPHQRLFLNDEGENLAQDSVKNMIDRLGRRAKVEGVHVHRFRHTFAIEFLRNGGNVFELQKLLGHSTLDMERKYVDIAMTDLEAAHDRASPVDNWKLK